jgi:magnesium transporter
MPRIDWCAIWRRKTATTSAGRLVGIATHDDAADVMQAEATEDFQKISYVLPFKQTMREASIGVLYSRRIVWLALLVFGNLFSGADIAYFEDVILAYVSLVFFLPLLIDSSGNAGSQSATLMGRALATGDVEMKDWRALILREMAVAAGLGATMAAVVIPLGAWRGSA